MCHSAATTVGLEVAVYRLLHWVVCHDLISCTSSVCVCVCVLSLISYLDRQDSRIVISRTSLYTSYYF